MISITINKNSKKNYLNVQDAVEVLIKIINKGKYRLYNIASDKRYSLDFISKTIQKITKCKIKYYNQNMSNDIAKFKGRAVKVGYGPDNKVRSYSVVEVDGSAEDPEWA